MTTRTHLLAVAALGAMSGVAGMDRVVMARPEDDWPLSPDQVAANKEYVKEIEPLVAKDKAKMEAAEERRAQRRARNLRNL